MPVTQEPTNLREELRKLATDAEQYFTSAKGVVVANKPYRSLSAPANHFWEQVPPELQTTANLLIGHLLRICAELAEQTKLSALTGSEDLQDIKIAAKTMRAALLLRRYRYSGPEIMHDEDTVLGFRPAEQSEDEGLAPNAATKHFFAHLPKIGAILKLTAVSLSSAPSAPGSSPTEPNRYRSGTAFIMMWMDPQQQDLIDVADAVRATFKLFDIRATRADDIEHDGLITERVIQEIKTSEFLFADLTGVRPNVYYEIGYAHALGKRVILYRKSGTDLHFDLAGYNCPEYTNLRDLKEKLTKRLTDITNRNPSQDSAN